MGSSFPKYSLRALGANGHPILLTVTVTYFVIAAAILSAAKGIFEVALYFTRRWAKPQPIGPRRFSPASSKRKAPCAPAFSISSTTTG